MKHVRPIGELLRKRAISLIEGVLYLVVALAVIVGGIVFFQQSQLSNNVAATARAAVGISSQARALYQNQTGFGENEDLTLAIVRAGAVPSTFIDSSGDAIRHPFGGGVNITGNGKGFVISYTNISQAACLRLASIDETGVGPMGTGLLGFTMADEAVDPTMQPDTVGIVSAETASENCTEGAVMAVYYAQNPGAKYNAPSGKDIELQFGIDRDNPDNYPHPITTLAEACSSEDQTYDQARACEAEWSRATYAPSGPPYIVDVVCGAQPNAGNWVKRGSGWTVGMHAARASWSDCSRGVQSLRAGY